MEQGSLALAISRDELRMARDGPWHIEIDLDIEGRGLVDRVLGARYQHG